MEFYLRILILCYFCECTLYGCTPNIPTSNCGPYVTVEKCEKLRIYITTTLIDKSCINGNLVENEEKDLIDNYPQHLQKVRKICLDVALGVEPDDIFYDIVADNKCFSIEGSDFNSGEMNLLKFNAIKMTVMDKINEEFLFQCNEFRNNRISSRDLLYKHSQIIRRHSKLNPFAPFRFLLEFEWLLGIAAAIIGILVGWKTLTSR